ncbi:MAG: OB-fold domain-containing protein [Pseudomonadota bacterium]
MDQPLAASPLNQYLCHLEAGELAYQYSPAQGVPVFFPRAVSPYGDELEWRISKGLGTVYATTWIPVRDAAPYNVALIDMDEGFRLMSNVTLAPAAEIRIGERVRVRIEHPEGKPPFPVFERLDPAPRTGGAA